MKKILSILSIALFSTITQVEANTDQAVQAVISDSQEAENKTMETLDLPNSKSDDITLWETLDADKDGSISKTEAVSSAIVTDNWANLDTNKDEKLDIAEFSQLYSKEQ